MEIRSSIFEVRFHEVQKTIPLPYGRVTLNRLSKPDFDSLKRLCAFAGIGAQHLDGLQAREMRDVLLEALKSQNIRDKIRQTLAPIFATEGRQQILLLTTLLTNYHLTLDPSFIKTVTGIDVFRELMPVGDLAGEVFELTSDSIKVRSSIFADYAVQYFVEPEQIIDCVVDAALAAAERKSERQYRVLLSNLLQYSNLHHMLRRKSDVVALIIGIYERLRYDERINKEPLFWLQYAIAMVEDHNVPLAAEFIRTAYKRADERENFETYQIDTQAFRILLLLETATSGGAVERLAEIFEKFEAINSMLAEESHRSYAIKVLECVHPFIEKRRADFQSSERTAMVYWLSMINRTLGDLPIEFRTFTGSDAMRAQIDRAKSLLI